MVNELLKFDLNCPIQVQGRTLVFVHAAFALAARLRAATRRRTAKRRLREGKC
jgi:hypothetical protein